MAHCGGRLSMPLLLFSALNPFSSGLSVFFLLIYKTPGSSPVVQWLGLSDFTVVTWVWSLVGNEDPASTTRPNKQKQPPTTNLFMINKFWLSLNFSISKPPIVSVSKVTRQKSRVESTGFAVGWYWLLLLVWPLGPHADFLPLWDRDSNTILTGLWRFRRYTENSSSSTWREAALSWCHRPGGQIHQRLCSWYQALKLLSCHKIIKILLFF